MGIKCDKCLHSGVCKHKPHISDPPAMRKSADNCEDFINSVERRQWIPFKIEYDEESQMNIFTSEIPNEDQEILVCTNFGNVFITTMCYDHDCGWYLDSGDEFVTEAVAWMPLPETYNAKNLTESNSGHWIDFTSPSGIAGKKCSKCGAETFSFWAGNFCYKCGVKMRGCNSNE